MPMRVSVWLVALLSVPAVQDDAVGRERDGIRIVREEGAIYLNCADMAEMLDYELRDVQPQRLITFCRSGDRGLCIPVRLTSANHRSADRELFVAANVLSRALRCRVVDSGGQVTLRQLDGDSSDGLKADVPGYNADWGSRRGFHAGDTLPDIPLMDMEGNEVRFSQFLGKRYVLYCWASW